MLIYRTSLYTEVASNAHIRLRKDTLCEVFRMASAYNHDGKEWMLLLYSTFAKATKAKLHSVHFYA